MLLAEMTEDLKKAHRVMLMAKIFIVSFLLLVSGIVFIGFTSHEKVDYFEDKMLSIIYEDIRETKRDEKIHGPWYQFVIHRAVCWEQVLMYRDTQNCVRMYVNEVLSMARSNNAIMSEKTKFVQCVRNCPLVYEMCSNNPAEEMNCADMEAICLQFCMERGWRKYTGHSGYTIW